MPLFYQHNINELTKLGIWKIEEPESFYLEEVPLQRSITHPHKRLQHLAGRWMLKWLFPDFPYELIQIADTRKPYLANEAYHFSISHCGDFAAAIVSRDHRVGIDIEMPTQRIERISQKFLNDIELVWLEKISYEGAANEITDRTRFLTLLWSSKEAVFKWYGDGEVDFRDHIQLQDFNWLEEGVLNCEFRKISTVDLAVNYKMFEEICLTYVFS
jgi:phosphopantetheinyl transferase